MSNDIRICDPAYCDNCIYIGEGDFVCDELQELVVEEWTPVEHGKCPCTKGRR